MRDALLLKADGFWRSGMMEAHSAELIAAFRKLCLRIREQQASGTKARIAFIHFSYLRSWLLQEKLVYSLEAYDDRWYVDRNECLELVELPWLHWFVQEFKHELRNKLHGIVPEMEQDAILLREITVLHPFVREWMRKLVPELLALPEFQLVKRADVLRFRTGEYKDFSEQIWMEDVSEKDAAALKQWLEQKLPNVYMNSDFRGLNLSEGRYEDIDLRYSHCTGSDFSGSRLQRSVCIGTDFSHSNLSGADFSQSLLYDADFSGSDLRGARLTEAVGGERFIHEGMVLGFGGVRFNDADLEGANLLYADLAGADFRGANLAGAAVMTQDAMKWRLSEEQKSSIIWMEEDESGVPVPAGR
ncbi:hypothetical protein ABD76_25865 [Paenibacillus dendritiformis]|nr:hypothetical protein [Paenibacillus dendritiformis]